MDGSSLGFLLQRVHIARDLLPKACNFSNPFSISCRWAAYLACVERGFVGGTGPVEYQYSVADILCVPASQGTYREFAYAQGCNTGNLESIFCDSLTRRECLQAGFVSSVGVIGANAVNVGTVCLSAGSSLTEVTASGAELEAAGTTGTCQTGQIGTVNRCQQGAHRLCRQKGFDLGFGPLEYGNGEALMACALGAVDTGGLSLSSTFDGYERAAQLGVNVLGAPAFAGNLIYADVLFNNFSYSLLVQKFETFSDFVAPLGGTYSRDMCFFLNRGGIFQYDDNDDGEVTCVYSDGATQPVADMLQAGLLLKPGERLAFQGTPDWSSSGPSNNAWAHLTVKALQSGDIPVRRVRFPRWDTAYSVDSSLAIPAGTVGTAVVPAVVPPGKPLESSNGWYSVASATTIQGVTIFMSNGQAVGNQKVHFCVRVTQGGIDIVTPSCNTLEADLFTPAAYPNGSAFFPLNLAVPQSASVGVDFTFTTATPTALDFAAYLWLLQP
jgi:hypothetical protein